MREVYIESLKKPVEVKIKEEVKCTEWLAMYRREDGTIVFYGINPPHDGIKDLIDATYRALEVFIISTEGLYWLSKFFEQRLCNVYNFVKSGKVKEGYYCDVHAFRFLYNILREFGEEDLAELVGAYFLLNY